MFGSEFVRAIRGVFLASAVIGVAGAAQAQATSRSGSPLERGAYLVNVVGGCHDCHTPKNFGPKGPEPDMTRALAGHWAAEPVPPVPPNVLGPGKWGAVFTGGLTAAAGPWGVSFAANLTPDETGLKGWTAQSFIAAMRTGKHMGNGRPILPPMPWQNLANATDDDLKAMFAYLQSIKPVRNRVPMPIPPSR
jgi:mono/diheme cytochrome c family protein